MGRNHDYKSDPTCIYIADLKVPKTYITVNVGSQGDPADTRTPISVRFESICTTEINGRIYKLPKKDAQPFVHEFDEEDLLFKVNANKSDKIKINLKWVPVVVLPFLKKMLFEGVVQQSPLSNTLDAMIASGIDLRVTDDPLQATHYVTVTDLPDYNLQIMVLRARPVVSSEWCNFLSNSLDDVNSWLFSVRSDLQFQCTRGGIIKPDTRRPEFLRNKRVCILGEDVHSNQVTKLKNWLYCLSPDEVLLRTPNDYLSETSDIKVDYTFLVRNGTSSKISSEAFNNENDLWTAILAVDIRKLKDQQSNVLAYHDRSKREHGDGEDSTSVSQRRKRKKIEKVDDTNFFLFTPLLSHNQQYGSGPSEGIADQERVEASLDFQLAESQQQQPQEHDPGNSPFEELISDDVQKEICIKAEGESDGVLLQARMDDENSKRSARTTKPVRSRSLSLESTEIMPSKKKHKSKSWIVPEVSLADAIMNTKRQADDSLRQDLTIDDCIGSQLKNKLMIEEIDLKVNKLDHPSPSSSALRGRKNFKRFKKNGSKQDSITRTFIELVDNGNDVRFQGLTSLNKSEKLVDDFATEMEDVRGFQPDPSQLFVNEASDSDAENKEESFQFLSNNRNQPLATRSSSSTSALTHNLRKDQILDDENDDDDDGDDEVRFRFSRNL